MACWINACKAYKAYTIKTVLNRYPLKSIREIGFSPRIPFVGTPRANKSFSSGGKKMSLNNIEHGILRR